VKRTVRPELVVFPAPLVYQDLCLGQRVEHLSVEQLAFLQRRLDEFYGPMLGRIRQVAANTERSHLVSDVSDEAWREVCAESPQPFQHHDPYFQPFKESQDWESERFRKEVILDEMLEIFKAKMHLAYPSTSMLFDPFSQYVDQWHRPLPYEVKKRLNLSAEPLVRLHADVEAHFHCLRSRLSGEKRTDATLKNRAVRRADSDPPACQRARTRESALSTFQKLLPIIYN